MDIEKLISMLMSATYEFETPLDFRGNETKGIFPLIVGNGKTEQVLREVVHQWFAEQNIEVDMRRLGELEAKCKVYEAVIANSDLAKIFAPILESNTPSSKAASSYTKIPCDYCKYSGIPPLSTWLQGYPCSSCTDLSNFKPKEKTANKEKDMWEALRNGEPIPPIEPTKEK